ncbi:hypothetical protein [Sphingomonas sp. RIT328]|uniref:hypothetical protein n=1 Tax=Sphingomonas sp. RIT328 TaxID=1470591 RepID=UPI00044AC5EE|nr:hypothetical protein [Sphingomonas sp. RIT328]EZP48682.1 hypothetical protein BW41_03987 [Sphingomonas sp. RIT328]
MKLSAFLVTTVALVTPAATPVPPATPAVAATPGSQTARIPGFAAQLQQDPRLGMATTGTALPNDEIWRAMTRNHDIDRQRARWTYVRSLIARQRGAEAIGVLDVMQEDDPDLRLVDSFQLARGAALVLFHRPDAAIAALSAGGLPRQREACAWRARALADAGRAAEALPTVNCAAAAIQARPLAQRRPFLLAAARASLEAGQPHEALLWLSALPEADGTANLLRGRAQGALGEAIAARLRLDQAAKSRDPAVRTEARLGRIELAAANGWASPTVLLRQLDDLRFRWRGDRIEERALRLGYNIAIQHHDLPDALNTGATLFRYFSRSHQGPALLGELQAQMASTIEPGSSVPLDKAAGMFWDYRDLLPGGAEGDAMVAALAARLQAAGLYARAAQLLDHQLTTRAIDLTQGPLSIRVATLYILAGQPDHALDAIRRSNHKDYPAALVFDRKRLEAVALDQLGRPLEAAAVLQDVPDGGAIRAEIAWKHQDWSRVVAETQPLLPTGPLGAVGQAIVLRRAIALAMLHQKEALQALRERYGAGFARLPSAPVFATLTGADPVTPALLARAMAALPSVSPAGDVGDLLTIND